jgi:hypothetical protein
LAKAQVKNAASEKQVKAAQKNQKYDRDIQLEDIREVMRSAAGRRFMWRVLEKCGTFGSIWHASAAIHYNAGQQDIGHFIMSEIAEAGEEHLFKLMSDNYNKGEINV